MGQIKGKAGADVILFNARRLWYWNGAASLSELATRGVRFPKDCKFPVAVASVHIFGVIEILPVTPEAKKSIDEVSEWKS